jgi:hypothetical protein
LWALGTLKGGSGKIRAVIPLHTDQELAFSKLCKNFFSQSKTFLENWNSKNIFMKTYLAYFFRKSEKINSCEI